MMRSRSDKSRGAVSEVPAESSIGLVFLSGLGIEPGSLDPEFDSKPSGKQGGSGLKCGDG